MKQINKIFILKLNYYNTKKVKDKLIIILFFIIIIYEYTELNKNYINDKPKINKDTVRRRKKIPNHKNRNIESKINYYKQYGNNIEKYQHTHIYSDNIYWCWFQGINNAPKLYQATFNSVSINCNKHNIIVINKTNINQYVKFPSYILEKYEQKLFTDTHFSDLLRLELLIKYGGTWIDASVLITKYEKIFFKRDLFFFNLSSWFITSEKESPVLKTTRDLLYEYWRKENDLCYYFLFHEFFLFAYEKYKNDYIHIPNISNNPEHLLQKYLMKKMNNKQYLTLIKNIYVHKLNIKFLKKKI